MNDKLKFKKNESFYIRNNWIEKAINSMHDNQELNIFSKNNGTKILGIGSNMVKSLKYWLLASNLIQMNGRNMELTTFGEQIYNHDQYLDNVFSWFMIHYFLVINKIECPIFNYIYNNNINHFTKKEAVDVIYSAFEEDDKNIKKEYIEDDLNVFLKSYYNEFKNEVPEDNYECPFTTLNLINRKDDRYEKINPVYSSLSYLIIYFALNNLYKNNSFNIEDSFLDENSPYKIFNLSKNIYLQYLDEMKNNGLITINKTAGLNTVYFEQNLNITDIFNAYYGG